MSNLLLEALLINSFLSEKLEFNLFQCYMSKGKTKLSRESHDQKFTLSRAHFRTVVISIDINDASCSKSLFTSANI